MQMQITSRMCGVALTLMVALTYSVCLAANVERAFKTVRLNDDVVRRCLMASFHRRGLESPANEQVKQEISSGNVAENPAILSESARAMCEHLPIQWTSEKQERSAVSAGGRRKRACQYICYPTYNGGSWGVKCTMNCPF